MRPARHRRWRVALLLTVLIICVAAGMFLAGRQMYLDSLGPVSNSQSIQNVTVVKGMTVEQIARLLRDKKLIQSVWSFKVYVSSKDVHNSLQAGTYEISQSESLPEIVAKLTHGKIATNLFTIVPGQRLDQIKNRLIQDGYSEAEATKALDAAVYKGNPVLVDKPSGASLEGYLYPDSYQKTASTRAQDLIEAALEQTGRRLTKELRDAFEQQGLQMYEGITLASVVEQEVSNQTDRNQVAQVFIKRLRVGMSLESDVTVRYGALLNGITDYAGYASPYNTYQNAGLPVTPISNVSASSLQAVAHPANTDWLYFVSGDDGVTYFSKTLQEHESKVRLYCKKLCGQE